MGGTMPVREFERSLHPRVMMYSQDGLGLGHMRRTTSIAAGLLRLRPDACALTLADSRLGQFFESRGHHDYIKLPSILKAGPGDWRAVGLPLAFADVHAMRRDLIRSAVLNFQPHVLLVDHIPHGAMGELLPALEALRDSGADTKVVLGLRDILDAPEVVRGRWQAEGAYEAIERYYDIVLVYGKREVFDLAEQYHFPQKIVERMHYCGYVCTPETPRYAARVRAQHLPGGNTETKLIVAMAGGGADAYPMMRALLDALPVIQKRQPVMLILIAGPFMPDDQRRDLESRARGLPARVRRSVSDTLSYMAAADVLVSMAGYNTTMEALRTGTPTILVPRAGPSAEQRTRARLFSANGWVEMIDPDELDIDTIVEKVLVCLRRGAGSMAQERPDLRGLEAAAERLSTLLPLADSNDEVLDVPLKRQAPLRSSLQAAA
ncbi:MAG: glycosyl transferase [Herpetosiphonaceae bacterium]|nr:MAG: glycosyl transferase [Herpetosiphonaceae bacterium]